MLCYVNYFILDEKSKRERQSPYWIGTSLKRCKIEVLRRLLRIELQLLKQASRSLWYSSDRVETQWYDPIGHDEEVRLLRDDHLGPRYLQTTYLQTGETDTHDVRLVPPNNGGDGSKLWLIP